MEDFQVSGMLAVDNDILLFWSYDMMLMILKGIRTSWKQKSGRKVQTAARR